MSDTKPASRFSGIFDNWTNAALAFALLRLWLGLRSLVAGIQKFAGQGTREVVTINEFTELEEVSTETFQTYGFEHYQAIPESLQAQFAEQPFLPGFLTAPFYALLGYLLILMGLFLLAGVFVRSTLMAMGVVYTMLTFGLILINQSGGVAWLAIHVGLIAGALLLEQNKRWVVTQRF